MSLPPAPYHIVFAKPPGALGFLVDSVSDLGKGPEVALRGAVGGLGTVAWTVLTAAEKKDVRAAVADVSNRHVPRPSWTRGLRVNGADINLP